MLLPLDTIAAFVLLMALLDTPTDAVSVRTALLAMTLGALVVQAISFAMTRGSLLALRAGWLSPDSRGRISESVTLALRVSVVLVFWIAMSFGDWPRAAARAVGFPESLSLQILLGILPFIVFSIISWISQFPLHRESRPGPARLGAYLLHRSRYTFFILGVAVPVAIVQEGLRYVDLSALPHPDLLLQAGVWGLLFLTAWIFPLFLRVFWGCHPLPDGMLRQRIESLENKTGVRFSGTYIWDLGGGSILNAAAVGLLPPFRYLFLSRALLRHLSPEEVDAVVCHEMGHVRHRHLLFYFVVTIGVMTTVQTGLQMLGLSGAVQAVLLIAALVLYIRIAFGFASRRIERQADLFALETLNDSRPLREALERIGYLSGNIRNAASWHHMSIAERVAFLRAAASNPQLAADHQRHIKHLKLGGYSLAGLLLAAGLLTSPTMPQVYVPPPSVELAHYERLTRLLPHDPRGPLGVARQLAEADRPQEALPFALEARRRARTEETAAAADALVADLRDSLPEENRQP